MKTIKKRKKEEHIKIKKLEKKDIKNILIVFGILLVIFLLIKIFIEFLIPMILKCINFFLILVNVYTANLDNINILFFGGMIILFIGFKLIVFFINIWSKAMEVLFSKLFLNFKKIRKLKLGR